MSTAASPASTGPVRRAMVLAAGRGERLRPLTERLAKPAIPFCGRPILARLLDDLGRAGVVEAIVNLHQAPESVRAVVAARGDAPPRVSFSDETEKLLGTAGALIPVADRLRDGPFLLLNGDCVHSLDVAALGAAHARHDAAATLAVLPRADPSFGCLLVEDGRIVRFGGPVTGAPGERHFLSAMVVEPRLLDGLPTERRPFSTFGEWFPLAAERGETFAAWETEAEWHALDTRERYLQAQARWLATRDAGPHVAADALVAESATVDATSSVHEGCVVGARASVTGSALLPGARVGEGARVAGSLLGPGVIVPAGESVRDEIRA